ncbi:MAG: hypothetical protein GC134_09575 [Proteobacteria bacterium]|nr:hypothetical protein [Pseudomonadota bacterium]
MQNLPFSSGLKRHLPVFLQQVEQVFGLEPGAFANDLPVFASLSDIQAFEQVMLTSPVVQVTQLQLKVLPNEAGTEVTGLIIELHVMGMRFMSLMVFEDEGYMLRGHGFCLHSADEAKVSLNLEALAEAYLDEPFVRMRLILERAVAGFPVAALTSAKAAQAQILSIFAQHAEVLAATMEQMRGNALRSCKVSDELMADLPQFLSLIDKALTMVGYDLKPSLVSRWLARVESVGAENIRASDVEALFRIPRVPLMMYAGVDEANRELHYVWVPLTLSNKSVIHLEVGGERGRASLLFDFATLVVGGDNTQVSDFDPKAFRKFEKTLADAETRASYRSLIIAILQAFAVLSQDDTGAERARRRALLFVSSPQMEMQHA